METVFRGSNTWLPLAGAISVYPQGKVTATQRVCPSRVLTGLLSLTVTFEFGCSWLASQHGLLITLPSLPYCFVYVCL